MNAQNTKSRILGSLLAVIGTVAVASAAQAGDAAHVPGRYQKSVVVKFDDLNLQSTAGARAMYARLSTAAERACGNPPRAPDLRAVATFRSCYDRAMDHAVQKVGSQQVDALHATRQATGRMT